MIACRLFGLGEADGTVAQVIDAVPSPEESIAQNGQGPHGLGEVHAHEGANAGTLDFENVVIRANGEVVASQSHGEVGQRVALRAVDSVLAVPRLRSTNLLVAECQSEMTIVGISGKDILTYRSSARVEGRAIREVPVSRMAPVSSSSATLSPNAIASKSTSQ